jgi:CotS family spore coat protein
MLLHFKRVQLAEKFGIKVKQIKFVQSGVYRITSTKHKQYCLKHMSYSAARLRWIDRSLQKIARNGFPLIAWRRPNTNAGQMQFVKLSKPFSYYVLAPWLSGRWPSPTSLKDMYNCGEVLAKFHKSSKNFPKIKSGALNMIGKWPSIFYGYLILLETKVKNAQVNRYGKSLNNFLITNGDEIIQRANEAIQILNMSAYKQACGKGNVQSVLCHGDGGPTNFIITSQGTYLIDFETLRYDLRAYDLFRVIYNSCKDLQWKFSIAEAILDGYQSESSLKAWLRFPRRTCRRLESYNQSSPTKKTAITKELNDFLIEDRMITSFLKKMDNYSGKGSPQ